MSEQQLSTPGPFQANLLVKTRDHAADKDHLPPSFGRLNAAAINSNDAIDGAIPGNDTKYVKGDYTSHLMNNSKKVIVQKETREVLEDQEETIHGETRLTYLHGRDAVVGDEDKLAVNGTQEKFVLGQSEENYVGHHEVHAPTEFETKNLESGLTLVELKFLGMGASVKGRETEVKISGEKEAMFESFMAGLHEEASGHKGEAIALSDKAAVTADANARADVLPDVGLGTPIR